MMMMMEKRIFTVLRGIQCQSLIEALIFAKARLK